MEDNLAFSKGNSEEGILKRENIYMLIGCVVLGLAFNILFYGKQPLGVSYPVFLVAFYIVLLWNSRNIISFKFNFAWLLSIPILALSFTYLIFSNPIFQALNFMGIPILIIAQTTLITKNNKHQWYAPKFVNDILYSMSVRTFEYISKPFILLARLLPSKTQAGKFGVISKILIGVLISIPLITILVSLLSSADEVFSHFAANVFSLFGNIRIDEFIVRALIVLFITVTSFSYMWSLLNPKTGNTNSLPEEASPLSRIWDPVTVITVLFITNIIYVVFTLIQFTYLFGGATFSQPSSFTYAEYARRGFFELIVVTLINLSILLCSINLTKKEGKIADKIARILNSLLVVCTLVMLCSAHFRMSLYEEAYGYTYLRILTHAFMAFIFVMLVAALFKVWNEKVSLVKAYIIIALISYTVINYVNIDVVIARSNIERYHKTGNIDASYLTCLSYDAVPLLVGLINDKNQEVATDIQNYLYNQKQFLHQKHGWQAFNISGYRAKKLLSGYNLQYKAKEVEGSERLNIY